MTVRRQAGWNGAVTREQGGMPSTTGTGGLPGLELEFVAAAWVDLAAPLEIGPVLLGTRRVIGISGGRFDGPLLSAEILPGGADTQTVAPDGTAVVDTRYVARTGDGSLLTVATQGFRSGPPEVLRRLAAGEPVGPEEYSFRLTARLESAAPQLDWVNRTVFVAAASRGPSSVGYRLFAVR